MLSFLWGAMGDRGACGKGIVTALLGMGWTCVCVCVCVSVNYQQAEDFSLLQSTWISSRAHKPPIQCTTGVTWPKDKVIIARSWPLTSTSAEVKNEGNCNSTPPYTFLPCTGTTLPFYFMWQRCELIWTKVWADLNKGVGWFEQRCGLIWTKVWADLNKGVSWFEQRCGLIWTKVWADLNTQKQFCNLISACDQSKAGKYSVEDKNLQGFDTFLAGN